MRKKELLNNTSGNDESEANDEVMFLSGDLFLFRFTVLKKSCNKLKACYNVMFRSMKNI